MQNMVAYPATPCKPRMHQHLISLAWVGRYMYNACAMSRYNGEKVLVVPRAVFEDVGYFQGSSPNVAPYLEEFFKPSVAHFMDREHAEQDPSHKQIIPYVIFRHEGKVLLYTRGASGGETRLHDKVSLGIGGHINPIDSADATVDFATYLAAIAREIEEEITIRGGYFQQVLGVINDDTNDVGKVHLGVVHLCDLETDRVTANESSIADILFLTPQEIRDTYLNRLETWSQIALDLYTASPLAQD